MGSTYEVLTSLSDTSGLLCNKCLDTYTDNTNEYPAYLSFTLGDLCTTFTRQLYQRVITLNHKYITERLLIDGSTQHSQFL